MSMFFYEDTDDWPEYQSVKDDIRRLEIAQLDCYREIQAIESVLKSAPNDQALQAGFIRLKQKLKTVQQKLDEASSMYR